MRRAAVVLVGLVAAWARLGHAEPPAASPALVGMVGRGVDDAMLIGAGGELLLRGPHGWLRRGGGVATLLVRAAGASASALWAVGARPPLYRHDGTSWFALTGTHGVVGNAILSEPGAFAPTLAVGRRLYVVDPSGQKLIAAGGTAAPASITSIWSKDLLVADGQIQRRSGNGWRAVSTPEPIAALGPEIAIGAQGGLYTLTPRLAVVPALPGFRPRLAATTGRRTLVVGTGDAGWRVAELRGKRLVELGPLPGVDATDEPLGIIGDEPILIATRSGQVLIGDGAHWSSERVDLTARSETARPGPGPASIGPSSAPAR